jgi:hypothetical protein
MLIKLTAVLSVAGLGVLACAAGTGDEDIAALANGGSTTDAGRSAGEAASTPVPTLSSPPPVTTTPPATTPPSMPVTSEVTGSYTMDVACTDVPIINVCLISAQADKDVTFALPAGTKRSSIAYTVTPHGPSAGGTVTFAGTDPRDGTVHLRGFADAFSSVHIEVNGVTVVPE